MDLSKNPGKEIPEHAIINLGIAMKEPSPQVVAACDCCAASSRGVAASRPCWRGC